MLLALVRPNRCLSGRQVFAHYGLITASNIAESPLFPFHLPQMVPQALTTQGMPIHAKREGWIRFVSMKISEKITCVGCHSAEDGKNTCAAAETSCETNCRPSSLTCVRSTEKKFSVRRNQCGARRLYGLVAFLLVLDSSPKGWSGKCVEAVSTFSSGVRLHGSYLCSITILAELIIRRWRVFDHSINFHSKNSIFIEISLNHSASFIASHKCV